MRKAQRLLLSGLLLSVLMVFAAAGASSADTPFMNVQDIRPGMRGKGLTVIKGTAVQSFDVQVLGLTEGTGTVSSLILVKVSGSALSSAGGIAAGMSGSPVYIDGKLIGAVSYVFSNADPHYGLVTPIAAMLGLWDYEAPSAALERSGPLVLDGRRYSGLSFEPGSGGDVLHAVAVKTPVMLGGFGPRTRGFLDQSLRAWGAAASPGGTGAAWAGADEYQLQPGSPFGVQLLRGDLDMTAVGTVTWIDGSRFIGFGHPMFGKGATDFLATRAYVQQIVPSLDAPFKLASPFGAFGTITQDRSAGVAGHIDRLPVLLPIEISISDASGRRSVTLTCESVIRGDATPTIAASVALEGLDRCLDRIGAGSARVTMTVQSADPKLSMTRQNLFYHKNDIAAASVGELAEYLNFLMNNEFRKVDPTWVRLEAVTFDAPLTATITAVRISKEKVSPGEAVDLVVTVRPFRQASRELIVPIRVPSGVAEGDLEIVVRGGSRPGESSDEESKDLPMIEGNSFEEALQNWIKRHHNNDIIVQFAFSGSDGSALKEGSGTPAGSDRRPEPTIHPAEYVLKGTKSLTVEVVGAAGE